MKIRVFNNYYGGRVTKRMYKKNIIELEQGVTILIGCNGSGKSTLLKQIKDMCEDEKIKYINIDNYGNRNYAKLKSSLHGDARQLSEILISSEGENININLRLWAKEIGSFMYTVSSGEKAFILIDAIDSGFSIDNIIELKEYLFKIIIEYEKDKEVYIVCSANEYELCYNQKCFSVYHGEYVDINSYEDYRDIILESKLAKMDRYGFDSIEKTKELFDKYKKGE